MLKRLVVLVVALTCLVASPASAEVASCYGPGYDGHRTASGDIYKMWGFTAAHPFLPLGTPLMVCHRGHCARVVVTGARRTYPTFCIIIQGVASVEQSPLSPGPVPIGLGDASLHLGTVVQQADKLRNLTPVDRR